MNVDPFKPLGASSGTTSQQSHDGWQCVWPVPDDAPPPPEAHKPLGTPAHRWSYYNEKSQLLGFSCRFDTQGGKEFRPLTLFRSSQTGAMAWRWSAWPEPRPLYGLDRLAARPTAPVIVCEGEKSANAAEKLVPDYVPVTSPNGSKSATKADWSPLKGRHVIIWPDADEAGLAYADAVGRILIETGAKSVRIITPPQGAAKGWDAADALADGYTVGQVLELIKSADPFTTADGDDEAEPDAPRRARVPMRDKLMSVVEGLKLWHSPDGDAFATITVNSHRENWPIRSTSFRNWFSNKAYKDQGIAPSGAAIDDVLRVLDAQAHDGPEVKPWLRTGADGGAIYIDLCDPAWRVVKITADSWDVLDHHDCPFIRTKAMQALPVPDVGPIEDLRQFINASDDDFILICAWLVAALRPTGPYPVLTIGGEAGSGKSETSRLLRNLIDPNLSPIRSLPKDERDLFLSASNCHVIALDNLSKINAFYADSLCRLSTGGGFATRALHTDREEIVIDVSRPVILNGIPTLTDRADLADRSIVVNLLTIPEDQRATEEEIRDKMQEATPRILGALYGAVSVALSRKPEIKLAKKPRLADFALWATAAEPALGFDDGAFMQAYHDNREASFAVTFEADLVAVSIHDFILNHHPHGWSGTATELLTGLNEITPEAKRNLKTWPKVAASLGDRVQRAAPLLRRKGIETVKSQGSQRIITSSRAF